MTQVLLTLVDADDDPIYGALVFFTATDGVTPIASGTTDGNGVLDVEVSPGDRIVTVTASDAFFPVSTITIPPPAAIVPPAEEPEPHEVTLAGTGFTVSAPTPAATCVVYGHVLEDYTGCLFADVVVPDSRNAFLPSGGTGVSPALGLIAHSRHTIKPALSGAWRAQFPIGAKVRMYASDSNVWKTFTVPNADSVNFADLNNEAGIGGIWSALDVPISR